ncbi:MAG: hypothetical protein JF599_13925 [Verrucomicrobia bacterium]|nr:hypothetical protein [Verrucomicrobiota bacterium]
MRKAGQNKRLSAMQLEQMARQEWDNQTGQSSIGGDAFRKQWDDAAAQRMGGTPSPAASTTTPASASAPAPVIPPASSFNAKISRPSTGLLDQSKESDEPAPAPVSGPSFAAKVSPPVERQDNLGNGRKSDPYIPGGNREFAEGQAGFGASKARLNSGDMSGFSAPIVTPTFKTPEQLNTGLTPAERASGASVGRGTGLQGSASFERPDGHVVQLDPSEVGDRAAIHRRMEEPEHVEAVDGSEDARGSSSNVQAPTRTPAMPAVNSMVAKVPDLRADGGSELWRRPPAVPSSPGDRASIPSVAAVPPAAPNGRHTAPIGPGFTRPRLVVSAPVVQGRAPFPVTGGRQPSHPAQYAADHYHPDIDQPQQADRRPGHVNVMPASAVVSTPMPPSLPSIAARPAAAQSNVSPSQPPANSYEKRLNPGDPGYAEALARINARKSGDPVNAGPLRRLTDAAGITDYKSAPAGTYNPTPAQPAASASTGFAAKIAPPPAASVAGSMLSKVPDLRQPAAGGSFAANLSAPAGAPVNTATSSSADAFRARLAPPSRSAASNTGFPSNEEATQASLSAPDEEAIKRRKQARMEPAGV